MSPHGLFVMSSRSHMQNRFTLTGTIFLDDAVVLSGDGLNAYLEASPEADIRRFEEGRFILIEDAGDRAVVKTDALAQDTVYYFTSKANDTFYWAVSNSLLALTQRIRDDGFNPGFDYAGTLSFFAGNQSLWGGQPLSLRTLVNGARFVPAGAHLELTRGKHPSLEVVTSPVPASSHDYARALSRYVQLMRGRIAALIDAGYRFNLGLSGGIDSRMNFALMLPFLDHDAVRIHSNKNRVEDFEVVQQIQKHYGFKIKGFPSKLQRDSGADVYNAWKYGTQGVYLPLRVPLRASYVSDIFNVHGGNFRAGIYHVQPLEKRVKSLTKNFSSKAQAQVVQNEFLDFFKTVGVDIKDPIALDHHYINTRARFHYGLNWFRQFDQPLFTPHLSKALFDIYHRLEPWQQEGEQLIHDILQLTDPALIDFPFDSPEKGFSDRVIDETPPLAPISADIPQMKVYGRLPAMPEREEDHPDTAETFERLLNEDIEDAMIKMAGIAPIIDAAIEEIKEHKTSGRSVGRHRYAGLIIALARYSSLLDDTPLRKK